MKKYSLELISVLHQSKSRIINHHLE